MSCVNLSIRLTILTKPYTLFCIYLSWNKPMQPGKSSSTIHQKPQGEVQGLMRKSVLTKVPVLLMRPVLLWRLPLEELILERTLPEAKTQISISSNIIRNDQSQLALNKSMKICSLERTISSWYSMEQVLIHGRPLLSQWQRQTEA